MKRKLSALAVLLSGMFTLASCLQGNDDYTYTDDSAITSFTLGTLNRYVPTVTSSGETKLDTSTVDCSSYKFNIDQINGLVYNQDSLPYGTDKSKVPCTVYSKNSGYITIKSMTSDTLSYYSSSDSIDFTQPREFYIYSLSGEGTRKYVVTINVHQEDPDTFIWRHMGDNAELAEYKAMRAVSLPGRLFVFGTDGTLTSALTSTDGATWTPLTFDFNHVLAADAYKGVVTKGEYIYLCDNGTAMRSADGNSWEYMGGTTLKQMVAASTLRLYAYDNDGQMVQSDDDGQTWTASQLDDSADMLPTQDLTYACQPLQTNDDTYRLLIMGNRDQDTYAQDSTAQVWGKIEEAQPNSQQQPWAYYNVAQENLYKAPRLHNLQMVAYDGDFIAIGGKKIGDDSSTAFERVYNSADGGITWKRDSTITLPQDMQANPDSYSIVVDKDNFLWLICGGSGQVWRGRINRLGWIKEQDSFTE